MAHARNVTMGLAAVMLFAGGCSFFLSQGPPAKTKHPFVTCSDSYAPPVLDTVGTGLSAVLLATARRPTDLSENQFHGAIASLAVLLAVDTASSLYGYSTASQCRDALSLPQPEPSPPLAPLPPGPDSEEPAVTPVTP